MRLARRDVLVLVRVVVYEGRSANAEVLDRELERLAVEVKDRMAKCMGLLKQALNFCLTFKIHDAHGGVKMPRLDVFSQIYNQSTDLLLPPWICMKE